MKKINKVLMAICLIVAGGCSKDFLEIENKNDLTSGSFWKTEQHVQQGLIATYATLQTEWGDKWEFFEQFFIGITYRGDDVDNNKAEAYGAALAAFTNNAEDVETQRMWTAYFAGISRANQLIEKTPGVADLTDTERDAYIGEAKFLRAYFNFMLVNSFQNIPLITSTGIAAPSQATPAEVWAQIEQDLLDAEATMLSSHTDEWKGRATKWTAKAFLGKVYLFQEKWAQAETLFKDVVDNGSYDLLPNYEDNFNGKGENGVESVFEVQFTANREGGVDERNPFNWEVTPYALDGWELFYPSDWLMSEMMLDKTAGNEISDRVYQSVFFDDPQSEMRMAADVTWVAYADVKDDLNHPHYFKKYNAYEDRQGSYVGTNINIMRFADVLLMYAEALNENGKTTEAINQINKVRQRGGASDLTTMTKDALRTQIRHHERPVELAMEWGIRWFDLLRWSRGTVAPASVKQVLTDHGKPNVNNFVPGKHELNPIPAFEVNLNKNINQHTTW